MEGNKNLIVVLLPAIMTLLVCLWIEVWPCVKNRLYHAANSVEHVEWARELVSHLAFYGSVVGGFFGYTKSSCLVVLTTIGWTLGCLFTALRLTDLLERFEHEKEDELLEKMRKLLRRELQNRNNKDHHGG
jgi:hypothetical protein